MKTRIDYYVFQSSKHTKSQYGKTMKWEYWSQFQGWAIDTVVSLERTFVLRKVKNEFKGCGSVFHGSLTPTHKSSCWISAPSSWVFSFCIQVDVFRDSLAPIAAGTPKTLGDVFIQINTKIEFGKTVVLFQRLLWFTPKPTILLWKEYRRYWDNWFFPTIPSM